MKKNKILNDSKINNYVLLNNEKEDFINAKENKFNIIKINSDDKLLKCPENDCEFKCIQKLSLNNPIQSH